MKTLRILLCLLLCSLSSIALAEQWNIAVQNNSGNLSVYGNDDAISIGLPEELRPTQTEPTTVNTGPHMNKTVIYHNKSNDSGCIFRIYYGGGNFVETFSNFGDAYCSRFEDQSTNHAYYVVTVLHN